MTFRQTFIRCSQGILVLGGCVLLLTPPEYFPVFYRPKLMGLVAFIYSFGIQLPAMLFRIPMGAGPVFAEQERLVRERLQVALSIGFLLGGLGSLGLWRIDLYGFPYDKFVHVVFAMLAMTFGAYAFRVRNGWSLRRAVAIIAAVGVVLSIGWEYVEYASDRWLHFGYFGRLFDVDSLGDVISDLVGIGIGVIILWRYQRSKGGLASAEKTAQNI